MTYPTKFPSTVKDIPADTKFILIYNDTYSEAGYNEYDSSTRKQFVRTVTFSSEELMREYVTELLTKTQWCAAASPDDFRVIPYSPLKIEVKTVISM